jgi:regulatory protein
MKSENKPLTQEQALQRLRHFCAYAERCHYDVSSRLFELAVSRRYHDEIIATLIEEGYLNEERFARLFAGGHFRQKKWGRNKILAELKRRQISDYCIRKAFEEIDEEAYLDTLRKLMRDKWEGLSGNRFVKMKKATSYLIQKGYEPRLVNEFLQQILQNPSTS